MSAALTFVAPPPGFAPHTEFALEPVDGAEGLFAMSAADDTALRVFLLDPRMVLDDYAPVISDDQAEQIELTDAADALVLVVANPSDAGVSVNLMAPVVVNTTTGRSSQVILEDQDFPVRAPLL
ncbi:flagellar assembly protein FliW [Paramicrobacterium agarici]|uniref:flagellar assembly protein FliW n=1 Tax=Paramicrobacterium agarici TaxID=630514 RepID=UPI00114DE80A|nr:flagellar assembly protein FliW [Microbacterium agarici]TQO23639.1 flagellar assembly factor FliW [Microbacterium agarici]